LISGAELVGNSIDPLFARAKALFRCTTLLRATALVAGLATLYSEAAPVAPFAVAVLAALAELTAWRTEIAKSKAERALRTYELFDGFKGAINLEEVVDLTSGVNAPPRRAPYFSADVAHGAVRVLTNLWESTFFTRRLATEMAVFVTWLSILVGGGAFVLLIWSLTVIDSGTVRVAVARVATTMLMAIVGLGFIRLAHAYRSLARAAEKAARDGKEALFASPTDLEAIRVLHEYQVARAGGPLIPDTLKNWRDAKLNEQWRAIYKDAAARNDK
jgi:fatty acid desaturase